MLFIATYNGVLYAFANALKAQPAIYPKYFAFNPIYPNPFKNYATIKFAIPYSENKIRVRIRVYDICGREVSIITDKDYAPGIYILRWSGKDKHGRRLPSGVYFCVMEAGRFEKVRKIVKLR